ncbi:hypothetical protein Golob_026883, partial [Gossypium lobatum]|nr:hypothetical protein [Gossypium lobatum]
MKEELVELNIEDREEEDALLFGGVLISYLGVKRFLFKFFHEMNVKRVVYGSPKTFNNHLLFIHPLGNDEDPLQ